MQLIVDKSLFSTITAYLISEVKGNVGEISKLYILLD